MPSETTNNPAILPMKNQAQGGRPTPYHRFKAAPLHVADTEPPSSSFQFSQHLSKWHNDHYGVCGVSEEAFAKGSFPFGLDSNDNGGVSLPVFIQDKTVMDWAFAHQFATGSHALELLERMRLDGFIQDNQQYFNGRDYARVDLSDLNALKHAISKLGPLKLSVTGKPLHQPIKDNHYQSGWQLFGVDPFLSSGTNSAAGFASHSVSLCGYGSYAKCRDALNKAFQLEETKLPTAPDSPAEDCFLLFTWKTIGIIDYASLRVIAFEAWVRNPVTVSPPVPIPLGVGAASLILSSAGKWTDADNQDKNITLNADFTGLSSDGGVLHWMVDSQVESRIRIEWTQTVTVDEDDNRKLKVVSADGSLFSCPGSYDPATATISPRLCGEWTLTQPWNFGTSKLMKFTLRSDSTSLLDTEDGHRTTESWNCHGAKMPEISDLISEADSMNGVTIENVLGSGTLINVGGRDGFFCLQPFGSDPSALRVFDLRGIEQAVKNYKLLPQDERRSQDCIEGSMVANRTNKLLNQQHDVHPDLIPIMGYWTWFNGQTVGIYADFTASCGPYRAFAGSWQALKTGGIRITWHENPSVSSDLKRPFMIRFYQKTNDHQLTLASAKELGTEMPQPSVLTRSSENGPRLCGQWMWNTSNDPYILTFFSRELVFLHVGESHILTFKWSLTPGAGLDQVSLHRNKKPSDQLKAMKEGDREKLQNWFPTDVTYTVSGDFLRLSDDKGNVQWSRETIAN